MDLPTTPRQSRRGLWIALSVIVVVVAGCVGGIIAMSEPDKPTVARPTPSISWRDQPSPTPSKTVTLTLPAKIGDRAKITNTEHNNIVTQVEKDLLSKGTVFKTSFAGFYGTPDAAKNKVYLFGGLTKRYLAADEFDRELKSIATVDGVTAPTEVESVSAGSRPGVARCANTSVHGMPTAICGWTDAYSFVVVWWYNRTVNDEIKAEMIAIRDLIEIES